MRKYSYLFISVSCVSLLGATTAFSSEQTTKILQDYIGFYQTGTDKLNVGEKTDSAKATEWKNITLKSGDGNYQVVIPWMKVAEKLFGGFDLTSAPKTTIIITRKDMAPVTMVLESSNLLTEVGGSDAARTFDTTFDAVTLNTQDNAELGITAKINRGTGNRTLFDGENRHSTGTFSIADGTVEYSMTKDGLAVTSAYAFQDLNGTFDAPSFVSFAGFDVQNPKTFPDTARNIKFTYSVASGNSSTRMVSPKGGTDIDATFGVSTATMGLVDGVAALNAESADVSYTVKTSTMGMVPLGFTADYVVSNLSVPLDNMDVAKPANLKLALSGFNLSDPVWAMFDPTGALPRDDAELDIDITGQLRWLAKLKDLGRRADNETPPAQFEDVKINALNLKVAGAELQTSGAVTLDNAQFPPMAEGSVNISLLGADGLLQKLLTMGLVPPQYGVMVQAMKSMVFKPAAGGGDHLVSLIEFTKNGHISANGMALK
ncbi:MAG: hypothetical protein QM492_10820 [Rhodobacterales bacterium]